MTGRAWCPAHAAKNEWLLVDLGVASTISGVVTQGRGNVKEWITHFMISYSLDAYKWEFARDIYGNKKVIIHSQLFFSMHFKEFVKCKICLSCKMQRLLRLVLGFQRKQ